MGSTKEKNNHKGSKPFQASSRFLPTLEQTKIAVRSERQEYNIQTHAENFKSPRV